ncbi:glycosyltransferase, partial [Amylibacter sp.]|nr:glycosyltransferase [Amylibacter sp.]
YREGAPRTLIEAAAMARPLIATDVPGCREVVDNGETGHLCKVRDGDDLARSMEAFLVLTRVERVQMGLAGRAKIAAHFDQAIVVEAYRNALKSEASPFKQRVTQ